MATTTNRYAKQNRNKRWTLPLGVAIVLLSVVLAWAGLYYASLIESLFGVFMAFVLNAVGVVWGIRNVVVGWAHVSIGIWWKTVAVLVICGGLSSGFLSGFIWLLLVNYPLGGPY